MGKLPILSKKFNESIAMHLVSDFVDSSERSSKLLNSTGGIISEVQDSDIMHGPVMGSVTCCIDQQSLLMSSNDI